MSDIALQTPVVPVMEREKVEFAVVLSGLFRNLRLYSRNNQILEGPLTRFSELVNRLIAVEGVVRLTLVGDDVFFNRQRLKLNEDERGRIRAAADELAKLGVGGLRFVQPLSRDQAAAFIETLSRFSKVNAAGDYTPETDPTFLAIRAWLAQGSEELPAKAVDADPVLSMALGSGASEEAPDKAAAAYLCHARLTVMARLAREHATNRPKIRRVYRLVRRLMRDVVDLSFDAPEPMLHTTCARATDPLDPGIHAANTAILAVLMGVRLRLPKVVLSDLGMASIFADVGLAEVPKETLEDPSPLSADGWTQIQDHPVFSARTIVRAGFVNEQTLRQSVTVREHHREMTGQGYPLITRPFDIGVDVAARDNGDSAPYFLARLLAVADAYDAMVQPRPWRPPFTPDEALGEIAAAAGSRFDETLVRVLAHVVGIVPVGSIVKLNTGEIAIVTAARGESSVGFSPVVRLLTDLSGRPFAGDSTMDLARHPDRQIVATIDAFTAGIDPATILRPENVTFEALQKAGGLR